MKKRMKKLSLFKWIVLTMLAFLALQGCASNKVGTRSCYRSGADGYQYRVSCE